MTELEVGIVTVRQCAQFYFPGDSFGRALQAIVGHRDPSKVKLPPHCYGFQFYDQTQYKTPEGEVLFGNPKNYSCRYLIGTVITREDLEQDVEMYLSASRKDKRFLKTAVDKRRLLQEMKQNNVERLLQCGQGLIDMKPDDAIVAAEESTQPQSSTTS